MTPSARAVCLVFWAGLAACSRCGSEPAAPAASVERVLPAGAEAYVIVPSVERLGEKLTLLEGLKVASFAAQAAGGFESARAYVDALCRDLGIDPRSRQQLEKIGVAPGASAGVAVFDDHGGVLLALPIRDEGRIGAFIRTFAANRLGASAVDDQVVGRVTVHRLMGASAPRLAWASSHGYALIASQQAIDRLAGWAARAEADTLAADASLPASLKRLSPERDVVVYVPPGLNALLATPLSHVVLTLSLTPTALTFSADAPSGDGATLKLFEPKAGAADLLGLLPADAFLVARFTADPTPLAPLLRPLLGSNLTRAFDEVGLDLRQQVLSNLAPGSVVALSLAPTARLGGGVPALDLGRTNPFAWVHLSGVASARSAEVVGPTLEKLAAVAPRFGASMQLRDGAYVTTYAQGEGVHLAARGASVLFGSPLGRLEALRAADPKSPGPVRDAALREVLDRHAVALVIDLRTLSSAVRELPASAWGIGGFAIKASTLRWLDATDDLKAVTLTLGADGRAVQARVQLRLGPEATAAGDGGR